MEIHNSLSANFVASHTLTHVQLCRLIYFVLVIYENVR